MKRVAFTLIELVFATVVVGIVILSIPLIVKQSNANTIESQNVFGYYNALTLMETIKNKPWDRNNVEDFEKSGEYYILYTGNTDIDCYNPTGTNIWTKKGLGNANRRRMCDPDKKTASSIPASYLSDLNSIDAFNGYSNTITTDNGTNERFRLDVQVKYVNIDFGSGTSAGQITDSNIITDVKAIVITLSKINPGNTTEEISTYTYYAANIGNDIPFSKDNE